MLREVFQTIVFSFVEEVLDAGFSWLVHNDCIDTHLDLHPDYCFFFVFRNRLRESTLSAVILSEEDWAQPCIGAKASFGGK